MDTIAKKLLSPNYRVHRAMNHRDPVALAEALRAGGSPHFMPRSGSEYIGDSPVHIAVRNDDAACLRVLIEHNASLNSAGFSRQWPLDNWFDFQRQRVRTGARLEDIPEAAWEVGALLVAHGATLGSGGRGAALSGVTPQDKIDRDPEVKRIQQHLNGPYQAERLARSIAQQTVSTTASPAPRAGPRL